MINLRLSSWVLFVENKTFKTSLGSNEDGSRAKFPALFSTNVQYCGRGGRGETVASLRMRKYTFFYHKFVLQGVFSKGNDCKSYIGISIYILSGAHGLPIGLPTFFNRFDTRAHEWKTISYGIENI